MCERSCSPADSRMRRAAIKRGYRLDGLSRQCTEDDFGRFDLIVAMDRDNQRDILPQAETSMQRLRVKLFSDFLSPDAPKDVPDPYYEGNFEYVYELVED